MPVPLDDKIYLRSPLRLPIIGAVSVERQLHIDVIFNHAAFKIVKLFHHIQNIIGPKVFFGAEESQVGHINLKGVNVTVILKGLFNLLHLINPGRNSRQAEPLNGIFKFGGSAAFFYQLILKAGVLFRKLNRNIVIGKPGLFYLI